MLMSAVVFSLAASIALFVLLLKLNIRRVLGYDVAVDIACTIILISAFEGTVTGMAAAMFAGCVISLMLFCIKLCIGFERLQYVDHHWKWVRYEPVWTHNLARRIHEFYTRFFDGTHHSQRRH